MTMPTADSLSAIAYHALELAYVLRRDAMGYAITSETRSIMKTRARAMRSILHAMEGVLDLIADEASPLPRDAAPPISIES